MRCVASRSNLLPSTHPLLLLSTSAAADEFSHTRILLLQSFRPPLTILRASLVKDGLNRSAFFRFVFHGPKSYFLSESLFLQLRHAKRDIYYVGIVVEA